MSEQGDENQVVEPAEERPEPALPQWQHRLFSAKFPTRVRFPRGMCREIIQKSAPSEYV